MISDNINSEIDSRKLKALVESGELEAGDLEDPIIISESPCCGADMYGDEIGNDVLIRCRKCGGPCSPDRSTDE